MSSETSKTVISKHEPAAGSFKTYLMGFVTSIVLTLGAFILVERHVHGHSFLSRASNTPVIAAIVTLASIQLLVQLFFFLHLGKETKPRWKLVVFIFMLGVIIIIIAGSLWIMSNLNYRMTPAQVNNYLQNEDSL